MIFFCPNCWAQVKENQKICPDCGEKIESFEQFSYFDKLTRALHHPEADTRMRAAYILGEIGDQRAVLYLTKTIDGAWGPQDLFFLREVAVALGKISGSEAIVSLERLLGHPSFIVREAALNALRKIGCGEALRAVRKALNDPNSRLRKFAQEIWDEGLKWE